LKYSEINYSGLGRIGLLIMFACLGLTAPHVSAADCQPAPSGLIGWWPGEGNANDIIGANNGTLQGGATATNAGVVGSCFSFDGTNGYVQIPDSSGLEPSNLTVECWVNFRSTNDFSQSNPGHQYIVFKRNTIPGLYQNFGIAYGLGKDRYPNVPAPYTNGDVFYFNVMGTDQATVEVDSNVTVATNTWYYLAAVRGSNYIQLYVNGQFQGQASTSVPQDYNGSWPLYFGTTGQSFWDGKLAGQLDEVSLYNRALSSNEIAAIYLAGGSGKCRGALVLPHQNNLTNNELTTMIVTNTATDNGQPANTLTYTLTVTNLADNSLVTNALIDTNGIITWTPTEAQGPSTNTFTTVVTDNGTPNLSAMNTFTVVVNEVNTAPVLPPQFNRTIHGKLLMTVTNTATDSDIPANPLTYTLLAKPNGATINAHGVISWTPTTGQVPSTNTITTVVTDTNPAAINAKSLSATNSFTAVVTISVVNTSPWLPPQTNQAVNEQTTLVVTNTAMDSNIPANALAYALLAAPTGAVIDTNGIITWTPTEAQGPGTNTITTVVTDNGSPPMSATNSFTVIVNEVNTAPVLPGQSTKTIAVLATLTVTNAATDSDIPANPLAYVLTAAPAGAAIDTNGVITWTPNAGQGPSTNTITTVVTDSNPWAVNAQHLSATNSFTVIVTGGSPPLVIQSIGWTNGIVTITWSAVSGQSYRLQYKANLTDSVWSDATPDFTATGSVATGTNGVNNATQRFYQVKPLP
jgi:hypothetical protein